MSGFAGQVKAPKGGNSGAAILDAVMEGLDYFDEVKPAGQRVIVLLSQPYDSGSTTKLEDVIHRLGSTNTAIYSVTFSPAKTWLHNQFTKPRHEQPYYKMSPDYPPLLHTFDWGTPLKMALTGCATIRRLRWRRFPEANRLTLRIGRLWRRACSRWRIIFRTGIN